MRALRVIEFVSLDGVMQSPHHGGDTEGGFRHGGWDQYGDDVLNSAAMEGVEKTDAYLFGRKTYEEMAAYWPTAPSDNPMAQHLNRTPKFVASRTLRKLEWQNSTLIEGDVAEGRRHAEGTTGQEHRRARQRRARADAHRARPGGRVLPGCVPARAWEAANGSSASTTTSRC